MRARCGHGGSSRSGAGALRCASCCFLACMVKHASGRCTCRRYTGAVVGTFHAPFAARVANGATLVVYLKGARCALGNGGRHGRPRSISTQRPSNAEGAGILARNYEGTFQIASYLRRISVILDFGTRNTKKNTKTHLRISMFNTHCPPTTCVPRCFILTTHLRTSVFYTHYIPVLGQCRAYGGMGHGLYVIWGRS